MMDFVKKYPVAFLCGALLFVTALLGFFFGVRSYDCTQVGVAEYIGLQMFYVMLLFVAAERCYAIGFSRAADAADAADAWLRCQIDRLHLHDGDVVKLSFPPDTPAENRQIMMRHFADAVMCCGDSPRVTLVDVAAFDLSKEADS